MMMTTLAKNDDDRHSQYPMIQMDVALECVIDQAHQVASAPNRQNARVITASLADALNYVLAEDVVANESVPPFPASMMDGYAVVAADGVGEYPVVANITAGDNSAPRTMLPGQVMYITTGAPLPAGADAVQMVELTAEGDQGDDSVLGHVKILEPVEPGRFVRPVGCDIMSGDVVVTRGTRLTPAELAVLASVGVVEVRVFKKPVVGVLSTGDELLDPTAPAADGKVRDSNRVMLLAALREHGYTGVDCGIAADVREELGAHLRRLLSSVDVLITTGGVSMGTLDLMKPLLADMGTIHFGRLLMKPGKPTTFATVRVPAVGNNNDDDDDNETTKLVFGLPGNPVSALVSYRVIVEPALRLLSGHVVTTANAYQRVHAKLLTPVGMDPQRPEYHRVHVCYSEQYHSLVAVSTGVQRSSRLLSTSAANGLMEVPMGRGELASMSNVSIIMTDALLHESAVELSSSSSSSSSAAKNHDKKKGHGHGHHHHRHHHGHHHHHGQHSKTAAATATESAQHKATHTKNKKHTPQTFNVALLVVSDRCSKGEENDECVPTATEFLSRVSDDVNMFKIALTKIVPDDRIKIQDVLMEWSQASQGIHLILTMGGTGFGVRDVTPEATKAVVERDAPGLVIAMITAGLRILPHAMLARPCAGTRGRTLIINLPGRPKAVEENLDALFPALPHAVRHMHQDTPSPWGQAHN